MSIDHDILDDALRRAGSNWSAAQAHGLLSGQLAVGGTDALAGWSARIQEDCDTRHAATAEVAGMLNELAETNLVAFRERMSAYEPLLPDDAESLAVRIRGLSEWAEGYLHGLVSSELPDGLRKRLAEEPIADIIKDMLEITRAESAADDSDDEEAYAELVEYLRVAAQLVYEELAGDRNAK